MSKKIWTSLWIVNFIIAIAIGKTLLTDSKNSADEHSSDSLSQDAEAYKTKPQRVYPDYSGKSDIAKEVLSTHWQDLSDVTERFAEGLDFEDPADQEKLRALVEEISSEIPSHGLDFLRYYTNYPIVVQLEREIVDKWYADDSEAFFSHYVTRGDLTPTRQVSALVHTFANANKDDYGEFISWFETLGDEAKPDSDEKEVAGFVQREVSSLLGANLKVDQFPKAIESLTQMADNIGVSSQLALLLPYYGEQSPEFATSWLEENKDDLPYELYINVFDSVLERWGGGINPHLASDLLSKENFFETLYRPEDPNASSQKQKEEFFDQRLKSMLRTSVGHYPEDTSFNAELFHDPVLRKEYIERSLEFIPEIQQAIETPQENP